MNQRQAVPSAQQALTPAIDALSQRLSRYLDLISRARLGHLAAFPANATYFTLQAAILRAVAQTLAGAAPQHILPVPVNDRENIVTRLRSDLAAIIQASML